MTVSQAIQGGQTGVGRIGALLVALGVTRLLSREGAMSVRASRIARSQKSPTHFGRAAYRKGGTDQGRTATRQHPARGWNEIFRRVYADIGEDRVLLIAAGVTFYALLALFPALAAFVSLYGLIADPNTINAHLAALSGVLPGGAIEIIGEQVRKLAAQSGGTLGVTFFFGLLVSLWSANAGMKAIFDALNVVYEEEEKRGFIKLTLQSLLFTVGAILFLLIALIAVAVVPIILQLFPFGALLQQLMSLLRWPILLLGVLFALTLLYRYGPSRDRGHWRWVTWGSALAAFLWIIGSVLFSWYVANFGKYNETYGSLGAAIGFMTWMWLSTTAVLIGAEMNAEMEHTPAGADEPVHTG